MRPYSKQVKAQCILWMYELQSPTAVRTKYRTIYALNNSRDMSTRKILKLWYSKFLETGQMSSNTKRGRKPVGNDVVERLKEIFRDDPGTSINLASQQIPISVGRFAKAKCVGRHVSRLTHGPFLF